MENMLLSGAILNTNESLFSENGKYQLIMQGDGNLVLYLRIKEISTPLWASNTYGSDKCFCVMQGDGNLVVYDPQQKNDAEKPIPKWASNTNGHEAEGAYILLQDDGNLVMYRHDNAVTTPKWATNTEFVGHSWMGQMSDEESLANMSIPGTHDSYSCGENMASLYTHWAETQHWNVKRQLHEGIRFLDVRVKQTDDTSFAIHHGSIYLHKNFTDVIRDCQEFLTTYPTECILMRIKKEQNSPDVNASISDTFHSYFDQHNLQSWWYTGTNAPKLSDVRGKVILLRDFSLNANENYGINYKGLTTQDEYNDISIESKLEQIKKLMEKSLNDNNNTWFVNYLSANNCSVSVKDWLNKGPYDFAEEIVPNIASYIYEKGIGKFGTVVMDFPSLKVNIIRWLAVQNER